jgi:hypothetical protein
MTGVPFVLSGFNVWYAYSPPQTIQFLRGTMADSEIKTPLFNPNRRQLKWFVFSLFALGFTIFLLLMTSGNSEPETALSRPANANAATTVTPSPVKQDGPQHSVSSIAIDDAGKTVSIGDLADDVFAALPKSLEAMEPQSMDDPAHPGSLYVVHTYSIRGGLVAIGFSRSSIEGPYRVNGIVTTLP